MKHELHAVKEPNDEKYVSQPSTESQPLREHEMGAAKPPNAANDEKKLSGGNDVSQLREPSLPLREL